MFSAVSTLIEMPRIAIGHRQSSAHIEAVYQLTGAAIADLSMDNDVRFREDGKDCWWECL